MTEPLGDNQKDALEKAVQQFIEAQLDRQEPDIHEFVKQYPGLEDRIRQRICDLQEIDGLFSDLMDADGSGSDSLAAGHDLIGKELGSFEVLRLIGTGGMGAVFLAHQASLNRNVALKVVSDVSGARSRVIERFQREATALAQLSHPNIVPIYEVGQEGPYFYFAMEYVAGLSLDVLLDRLRRAGRQEKASDILRRYLEQRGDSSTATSESGEGSGVTIDTDYIVSVSRMMLSVASALEYAHQRGVLHRDIKPSNILIDASGTPKLVDFGLARLQTQAKLTVTGEFFGTPSYTSPEQIRDPEKVDCRSDVYSLAATYYECLTLQPPFKADTVNETLTKVVFTEPVPPKKHCPRLSNDFNTVLLHALQKRPEDRYQTAAQFAADIENILNFKPITAKRPSLTQRGYRALRRNPAKVIVFGVSILAIVLGYFLFSAHTQEQNRSAASKLNAVAEHQFAMGKYAEALSYYEKALQKDPASAEIYRKVGLCYQVLGREQEEIEAYQQAVRIAPDYNAALLLLAQSYERAHRRREEIEVLAQVIGTDPNCALAYYKLGSAYIGLGNIDSAIRCLRSAVAMEPNHASARWARHALGVCCHRVGRYEEAVEAYKRAVAMDPDNARAYADLGITYNSLRRHDEAAKALERAVALDPNSAEAYYNLGLAHTALSRRKEAIDALTRSLNIDPNRASAYFVVAMNFEALEQYREVITPLLSGLELDPNAGAGVFRFQLAQAYHFTGRYEEAIIAYRQYLDVKPSSAAAYRGLGFCYTKCSRNNEALEAYRQAVAVDPNSAAPRSDLAWHYSRSGQYQLAIEAARDALRIDPNHAEAFGCLGASYVGLGDYAKSIEVCRRAIAIDPSFWQVHSHLGFAYQKLGRYQEAIRSYTELCQSTDYKDHTCIADLASAYSQSGDFRKAVECQEKALELAEDKETKQEYKNRLEAYQAGKGLGGERAR